MFAYAKLETPGKMLWGVYAVLFMDIVQFTQYGDNDQLKEAVRVLESGLNDVLETLDWDLPSKEFQVVMMPAAGGYGIGFAPEVPDEHILLYAAELSCKLKNRGYPVRIGLNKGPCFAYKDLNAHLNLAGWAAVEAERCMALGDRNHILCTEAFAAPYLRTREDPNLHCIGSYAVGEARLGLYNYYSDYFGNEAVPIGKGKKIKQGNTHHAPQISHQA